MQRAVQSVPSTPSNLPARKISPTTAAYCPACSEKRPWINPYKIPSYKHMLVGGPDAKFPPVMIQQDVWGGFAVILICGRWPFRVCAQIVDCIPIRRSASQSIMVWQNSAHVSGFVLRDRIIAVYPVPMGDR